MRVEKTVIQARRPGTIRKYTLIDIVFALPVTLYSTYLHRRFCISCELHDIYWQAKVRVDVCDPFHAWMC